jgi:anaerobic selenocysteine-containing dehydrogenase
MAEEKTPRAAAPDSAPGKVSRRGFFERIGLGLAAGAGAAAAGCSKAPEAIKTAGAEKVITVCPFCGVGCGQTAFVKGGQIVHVEGDPHHPISEGTLCSKGAALSQVSDNALRLKKVLHRAPGASSFEEKSWDWAMERIAQRVKETRDATFQATFDGKRVNRTEAIACLGGAALDNEECYLLVKAMRMFGITYIEHQARI